MATWLLAVALALAPAPSIEVEAAAPVPSPAEILAVPPALHDQFHQWIGDEPRTQPARLERLVAFLFDESQGLGLQYEYGANYTVSEVYASRQVNCLSFTLITIALARDVGLDAYAQEIEDVLTWFQEGSTVYRNNHVNAGIRIGHQRYSADVAWDEVITRQQPRAVSDMHMYALFYNNRAVTLLAAGQRELATAYLDRALQLSGDYAPFWNNAGVMAIRNGDQARAEADYLKAMSLNHRHSAALFNLISLYGRQGRQDEMHPLQKKLERLRQRDPFDQFLLALERERAGDYAAAVKHYQRAIRLYPDEHRFYEGLARAWLLQGEPARASRAMERARSLSEGVQQTRYQARLDRLRNREADQRSMFGPDRSRVPAR